MKFLFFSITVLLIVSIFISNVYAQNINKTSYSEAKATFINAKNAYEQARDQFNEAKQNYLKIRSIERKNIVIQKGTIFLINSLERIISHLELIKSKVESSETLTESEKLEIIEYLEDDLNYFKQMQNQINSSSNHTIQELSRYFYDIKNRWLEARKGIMRAVGKYEILHIDAIIKKENTISEKIQQKIEELKTNGTDTSQLEILFSKFKENITIAIENLKLAREQHNLLINASKEERENILNSFLKYLHSAQNSLKEANKILKQIHETLKNK